MGYLSGVHLLPATGEFTLDTTPARAKRATESALVDVNRYFGDAGLETDFSRSLDQLALEQPGCKTVSLIVAWFGDSLDASTCRVYPATTYIGGAFQRYSGGAWATDHWRVSGLTEASAGLVPISRDAQGHYTYGGTPSDPCVVRAIGELKARGYRVVFYPFLLMDALGLPWRGRITFATDKAAATTSAVNHFFGAATAAQFTRDAANLTVAYSGSSTDYSYRRMILHYANLCALAGGVDLFLLGSEFVGLEQLRGPGWTKAGTVGGDGLTTWDYPFVDGLGQLADDVRGVFNAAGLTKDTANRHNLIAYSADWSVWTGVQHAGENGQWPHLDQLFGRASIDLVGIDDYLPLTDWTTGSGGLDAAHWAEPAPSSWPPSLPVGLGLEGMPSIYSLDYLKAGIEGGEKYHWWYADSTNGGRGSDPNGGSLQVSRPAGDRLTQTRRPYYVGQELLANKQLRWWWHNTHKAVYDTGDGSGWIPRGGATKWKARTKPIALIEYGFSSVDRATNQPNLTFDPRSVENATPYWSQWRTADGSTYAPMLDEPLMWLALRAIYEYWTSDGNNEANVAGRPMVDMVLSCAWNWDARPYPVFPNSAPTYPYLANAWGDTGNWAAGKWLSGKGNFDVSLIAYPLAWPLDSRGAPIRPTLVSLYLDGASRSGGKTLTGAEQVVASPAARWTCRLVLPAMDDATLRSWRGFLAAMSGRAGRVVMPAFDANRTAPAGTAATAAAAALNATSLVVTLAAGGPIHQGSLFSIGGRLHTVSALAQAGAVYTIGIAPPLRAAIADGAACEFAAPVTTMGFSEDAAGKLDLESEIIAHADLTLVEGF